MRAIKEILFIFIVLISTAAVFNAIYFLGRKVLFEQDSNYIVQGLSAFMGAFFAFLFLILERLISKQYSRTKNHRNALVKLERYLQEAMFINGDNIYLLNGFITNLEKDNKLSITLFNKVDFTKETLIDIQNIDLINDVFSLSVGVYKNNASLATLTNFYDEIRLSLVDGKIDLETYKENCALAIIPKAKFLKRSLEAIDKELQEILAKTRILMDIVNKNTMTGIILRYISPTLRYPSKKDDWYKNELEVVRKEIEEIKRQSQEEIDKL